MDLVYLQVLVFRRKGREHLCHWNMKVQVIYKEVQRYTDKSSTLRNEMETRLNKFSSESAQLVHLVSFQLSRRTNYLTNLERGFGERRARLMKMLQLTKLISNQCSTMEMAFSWAIKTVLSITNVLSLKNMSWEERDMVLRRVFVLMNLEQRVRQNNKSNVSQIKRAIF